MGKSFFIHAFLTWHLIGPVVRHASRNVIIVIVVVGGGGDIIIVTIFIKSGCNTLGLHVLYYMFRPVAPIIRSIELFQSPFFLAAMPFFTGQSIHIGSASYRYVFWYKVY